MRSKLQFVNITTKEQILLTNWWHELHKLRHINYLRGFQLDPMRVYQGS